MYMSYQWNFSDVLDHLPFLLEGIKYTVGITALAMAIALILGLFVSLLRLSGSRWLSVPALIYTEVFRGTPFLVQIVWFFYALPLFSSIVLSPFQTGVVAGGLNLGAFCAEIFRAGILSIPNGQREAASALGMNRRQAMRRIILPQAVVGVIPPLGSIWVSLFKDTSLLAAISVPELMFKGQQLAVQDYRPMEVYTIVALIYFIITYPQARLVDVLFHRLRVRT
jgi:polar amino acid transport system permease protein